MDKKELCIPSRHPALAGHFPGRPVVPGVVILDEVINAAESLTHGSRIMGVGFTKFLRPLLPGQRCSVEFSQHKEGRIDFVCRSQDQVIATGQLVVDTHRGEGRNEPGLAAPA